MLSMLALWAGISIVGGFDRVGGALAMTHSVIALLFTSNVWTPKVDQDQDISHFLLVVAEFFMSLIVLLDLQAEIPLDKYKEL